MGSFNLQRSLHSAHCSARWLGLLLSLLVALCQGCHGRLINSGVAQEELGTTRSILQSDNGLAASELDTDITEDLNQACSLGGGIDAFFRTGTSGEVCQLAASVIGRGNRRTYTFTLEPHHVDISFQVVLQPLEGSPIVSLEHIDKNDGVSVKSMVTWSSGNSFIYVAKGLRAGKNQVVLESKTIVSTFSLRIEFFRGNVAIHDDSRLVLKLIKEQCCVQGPCTGVLDMVGTQEEANICSSAGNHCDGSGHLTHLDLSESNMHCDLSAADFPLVGLDQLQVFMLNDNDIKGDISSQEFMQRFSRLKNLEILELGNLPNLKGSISPECPAPFTKLIHLGLSNTTVGGAMPDCIVNQVHQLEISHTQFSGDFPDITASSNLRYLIAATHPSSSYKFTGKFPSLEFAEHLHYVNFANHDFTGRLTLANNIEAVIVQNNMLSEIQVTDAPRLQLLYVEGNKLGGELPSALTIMPQMQSLHVDRNEFNRLPASWSGANLREFTASENVIEGKLPALFSSMPHLRRLVLARNKMSGELDDFSANIPQHSKLQWVDLAHNKFSGPLFAPALVKLAAFSSVQDEYQDENDLAALHVFDASHNHLIGDLSAELIVAIKSQIDSEAELIVDLRGNGFSCPSETHDSLSSSDLDPRLVRMLGCKSEGGSGATRAVVGTLIAFLLIGFAVGAFMLWRRRQSRKGWFRDQGISAHAYAQNSMEASQMGGANGWFTGKTSDKQYAAGLDDTSRNGGVWGLMPFMSRSKQPVSTLLGGWSRADTEAASQNGNGGNGLQLPVSGARRDMRINTGAGMLNKPGAAVTSVELASPISDVSATSLPRNGGGVIGIDADEDADSEGARSERNMRVAFNAAYRPPADDQ